MTRLTASAVDRAMLCPPSAVLPHVESEATDAQAAGIARHYYLERVLAVGREAALAEVVPEEYEDCAALPVDELPASQQGAWAAEVALAYDAASDTGREVGRSIGRRYPAAPSTVVYGTADLIGLAEDEVVCLDYKGAHDRQPHDWQLKTLLVAACRAYDRPRGRAATISLRGEERPYWRWIVLDEFALEAAAAELRDLVLERMAAAEVDLDDERLASVAAGLRTGHHCARCPSFPICPAQTTLALALAGNAPVTPPLPLDAVTLPIAWEQLRAARQVLAYVERACHAAAIDLHARGVPVVLSDGRVLGPVETRRESIDGPTAYHALKAMHGPEIAEAAVEFTASKASIDRALRALLKSPQDRLAPLRTAALDAIRAAGGVSVKTTTTVREHAAREEED